eukprot:13535441-Heterocapsa_arctica.AAC.1
MRHRIASSRDPGPGHAATVANDGRTLGAHRRRVHHHRGGAHDQGQRDLPRRAGRHRVVHAQE